MTLRSFGLMTVLLVAIDAVYLAIRQQYHDTFFYSVQQSPLVLNYIAAVGVYVLLAGALLYGAVLTSKSWQEAAKCGAVIGGVMYGFYDFTNMATLRRWTWSMVAVDTAWGATLSALTAGAAFKLLQSI
jgi:uncharacterized membrane protein